MSDESPLARLQALKKQYEDTVKELGSKIVEEILHPFFETHPDVEAICWTQYTPFFNDGEACEFSFHGITSFLMAGEDPDEPVSNDYETDVWTDVYRADSEAGEKLGLWELDRTLDSIEDVLHSCFGDHVQVSVFRDGRCIVDEYDHE